MTTEPRSKRQPRPYRPYHPRIGSDFEVQDAATVDASTRRFLAQVLTGATVLALSVTAVHGAFSGQFLAIEIVWAVTGPIVGALVTYYFGPQRRDLP